MPGFYVIFLGLFFSKMLEISLDYAPLCCWKIIRRLKLLDKKLLYKVQFKSRSVVHIPWIWVHTCNVLAYVLIAKLQPIVQNHCFLILSEWISWQSHAEQLTLTRNYSKLELTMVYDSSLQHVPGLFFRSTFTTWKFRSSSVSGSLFLLWPKLAFTWPQSSTLSSQVWSLLIFF